MNIDADVTLLLVLTAEEHTREQKEYYQSFAGQFRRVIPVVRKGAEFRWMDRMSDHRIVFTPAQGKVWALNKAIEKVTDPAFMWLEDDEYCVADKLPAAVEPEHCYPALIDSTDNEGTQRNYQVRLLPKPAGNEKVFDGFSIPDVSRSFALHGWKQSEAILPIHKSGSLFHLSSVQAETAENRQVPMSLFWKAILDTENQKYAAAEQGFRQALKSGHLFEYNYLAALNGLTNTLVEQHKLDEAAVVAHKSLEANGRQRAPYLMLYKVYQFNGEAEKAYMMLKNYLDVLKYASRANLDVFLSPAECHFLMADTTFRQGDFKRAFAHYEQFYAFNQGNVSLQILEKLFIYAIELGDYEKSVKYFYAIFGEYLPDNLNEEMSARLLESLSLFMDNGWYDFVSNIYEQLVSSSPDDNRLLHGWITTLIKNKEIEKARVLASRNKAS